MLDLALTVAGLAGGGLGARLGAAALAVLALGVARDGDGLGGAEGRLLEAQLQVVAQVSAARRTAAAGVAPAKAEHIAEDVAELGEDVVDILEAGPAGAAPGAAEALVAEAVVDLALLGIGEHLVGLGRFLKAGLRIGIVWITIGMELHGELAISPLDFGLGGIAGDPENFVIVALRHDNPPDRVAASRWFSWS